MYFLLIVQQLLWTVDDISRPGDEHHGKIIEAYEMHVAKYQTPI